MSAALPPPVTVPRELLALVQLARRAREADNVDALAFTMVNESRQMLVYRQSALWLGARHGRVACVSGVPLVDPNAPYVQWLQRALPALATQPSDGPRRVLASDLSDDIGTEWSEWLPTHGLWVALRQHDDALGGLLFASDEPWPDGALTLAAELAHAYSHALDAFAPRRAWRARLIDALRPTKRRVAVALALLIVALFPVRQTVLAPAEVVPLEPFLVRTPQDGVVDRILVKPNQQVAAGTPLVTLDTTALQARYAVARKAYDAAAEEYRQSAQAAVTDDKSRLDMAQRRGQMEQKQVELDYTAQQLGRVQIKAERAGVAVFSDVNDWQGKAVAVGERIMTLADPHKVELAVELPAGERFDVEPGATVTLYPNANPLSSYDARITQVAYSAEATREGVVAYRLKAAFDGGTLPRVGLTGNARVSGTRVPLVYYALRRPLTTVRQWLGW
ncbi:MAG: HlyD family efflux transporter periplasmic adaptor subunit [Rhodocyclaceae bacterium]